MSGRTDDFEVNGLVIREVKNGESDKIITILTAEQGRITISGKGISSIRNRHAAAARLFTYSTFQLHKRGDFHYIRDTFYLEGFTAIHYDAEKLALANYICDVAGDISLDGVGDPELMSLTLNTLYAIANMDSVPLEQIKGAFEFRAAAQSGFMPDLTVCDGCGCELTEDCSLDVMNGRLLCKKCRTALENDPAYIQDEYSAKIMIRVSPPVLAALRFIAYAPLKKLLSFSLDKSELPLLAVVCERYLLNHIEHGFTSLEYYKKIKI